MEIDAIIQEEPTVANQPGFDSDFNRSIMGLLPLVPVTAVDHNMDSSSEELDQDGYISSGTSSYDSDSKDFPKRKDNEENKGENKEPKAKYNHSANLMDMLDEFEDPSVSSYARFKTQNEIDPEQVDKYAPKIPELDDLDQIVELGTVLNFIDDGISVVMVKPSNP